MLWSVLKRFNAFVLRSCSNGSNFVYPAIYSITTTRFQILKENILLSREVLRINVDQLIAVFGQAGVNLFCLHKLIHRGPVNGTLFEIIVSAILFSGV